MHSTVGEMWLVPRLVLYSASSVKGHYEQDGVIAFVCMFASGQALSLLGACC